MDTNNSFTESITYKKKALKSIHTVHDPIFIKTDLFHQVVGGGRKERNGKRGRKRSAEEEV